MKIPLPAKQAVTELYHVGACFSLAFGSPNETVSPGAISLANTLDDFAFIAALAKNEEL